MPTNSRDIVLKITISRWYDLGHEGNIHINSYDDNSNNNDGDRHVPTIFFSRSWQYRTHELPPREHNLECTAAWETFQYQGYQAYSVTVPGPL
jgi:hypothetical protein